MVIRTGVLGTVFVLRVTDYLWPRQCPSLV